MTRRIIETPNITAADNSDIESQVRDVVSMVLKHAQLQLAREQLDSGNREAVNFAVNLWKKFTEINDAEPTDLKTLMKQAQQGK